MKLKGLSTKIEYIKNNIITCAPWIFVDVACVLPGNHQFLKQVITKIQASSIGLIQ